MDRYRFDIAGDCDDAELRGLLAATPMPGTISLTLRREPSYFAASTSPGRFHQVLAVRDGVAGTIVGFGARSVSRCYVNGLPQAIGYLSSLRLAPSIRGQALLARGYSFLRELHTDGRTPLYLSTIAPDNRQAVAALTTGRAGLPAYHAAGRYVTTAISLARASRRPTEAGVTIRPASPDDLPAILEFLKATGPRRQFFPCYEPTDFFTATAIFRGLRSEDVLLVFRDSRLVGTLGAWDQIAFRQNVVHSYHGPLRWLRPLYNVLARVTRKPSLPRPGEPLCCLMGAIPVVAGDDPRILAAMLDALVAARSGQKWDYLLIGLSESDPLRVALTRYASRQYVTTLYHVCWSDGEPLRASLDQRPPYLELGLL